MEPWNGRETTDITYDDRDGRLTSLFIENEYLDSEVWAGRRPKYFIEVKSTTGPCDTPFFMSKNQYQMVSQIYMVILLHELTSVCRCKPCPTANLGVNIQIVYMWFFAFLTWAKSSLI